MNILVLCCSLKHLNLEKNELYYVPMLKSVEGQVVPNSDEKEVKKLRRSAEKVTKRSPRTSRSKDTTPRQPSLLKKDREETGEVPKPTPVPEGNEPKLENGDKNGTKKNGRFNPFPHMPVLGSSNSAANKDMSGKIWTNGDTVICLRRKHRGKRRNCSLRAISPFPTMFSKAVCC